MKDYSAATRTVAVMSGIEPAKITRSDIERFVKDKAIEMVNFMYVAEDGHLRTLNFVINSIEYLHEILTYGERVDGSSLFSFIEAGASDLYVVPRYATAFVDPFAQIPTLTMLCDFFDKDGQPFAGAPNQILKHAAASFHAATGLDFHAMGELEYYVVSEDNALFPCADQRGYHESSPFVKNSEFRTECMRVIASIGGEIKYGHSEVGNFTSNGKNYEQNEIEFLPGPALDAADQLTLAKWVIRNLALKHLVDVTFSPKIITGKAGSGLHIHQKLVRDGRGVMLDATKKNLTTEAKRLIAGLMRSARALTSFGNTNPTSYFRLVPNQEAPTEICWGDRNRSVLVRVPLGWTSDNDMSAIANPCSEPQSLNPDKQTIEIRSGDCSANIYLYLAAIIMAAREGFEISDALDVADKTYVDINIHRAEHKNRRSTLESLPTSCSESAKALDELRAIFERDGVFPSELIDKTIETLSEIDKIDRSEEALTNPTRMKELVEKYYYCG